MDEQAHAAASKRLLPARPAGGRARTQQARGVCTMRMQASHACRGGRQRTGRTTQSGALRG